MGAPIWAFLRVLLGARTWDKLWLQGARFALFRLISWTLWVGAYSMMLRRAKRAVIFASPIVGVGAWAGYVLSERKEAPPDVRFSIGSAGA